MSDPRPSVAELDRRVEALLARLTPDERLGLISGVNFFDVPGHPGIGLPPLGTADSPFGVRADGPSTVYPGGIALAATWNPALAGRIGTEIGRDARARGKHYSLGPGANGYRGPRNGRNFEYLGEDPWLASRLVVPFIQGLQAQGVSATIKHFIANESEYNRHTTDSRVDERTLREIYLPPFEAAVQEADVGAIMPAYNLVNGAYMTANRRLLVDLAKTEWGFRGIMMSDWGAVHDTREAANGGTDLEMPGGQFFTRERLQPLLQSGAVTQATIDDKVRRLLRNAVRFGWMERPQQDAAIPRYNAAGRQVALEAAREAMVLLKNDGALLPLDRGRMRTVAVIGPNAHPAVILGGGSATVYPFHAVSPLEGIGDLLGTQGAVPHARGLPTLAQAAATTAFATARSGGQPGVMVETFADSTLSGAPTATRTEPSMSMGRPVDIFALLNGDGTPDFSLIAPPAPTAMRRTGWYTVTEPGAHELFVQQGGFGGSGVRVRVDGRTVIDSWDASDAMVAQARVPLEAGAHEIVVEFRTRPGGFGPPFVRVGLAAEGAWVDRAAVRMAAAADAVVLAVGFDAQSEGEGWDRTFALPPGQEALVRAVAAANPRTVVVVNAGGGYDMSGWLDRVAALVQAWYPGELGGRALADLLFGDANFSGRLPVTFEHRLADTPSHDHWFPAAGTMQVPYAEGVFTGYRGFDRRGTAPRFAFGHGLSYTTFRYANLTVAPAAGHTDAEPRFEAAFDVTNTGARAGAAVAQLYVSDGHAAVARPAKELKGFAKVALAPGQTRRITLPLDLRALAYWDEPGRQWRADAGTFTVRVGGSSADLPLAAPLRLPRTVTRAVGRGAAAE